MAVVVLQPLAGQRGAPGRRAEQEAARRAGRRAPTSGRRSAASRTSSRRCTPGSSACRAWRTTVAGRDHRAHRAGLVDPLVQDLALLGLLVGQQQVRGRRPRRSGRAGSRSSSVGNSESIPNVRASSGMIGTNRAPISWSFMRSLSSRTNAIVVATGCLPEPFAARRRPGRAAGGSGLARTSARAGSRRAPRGAPSCTGSPRSPRPGGSTAAASASSAASEIGR